jgi:hypothetical protein
MKWGGGLVMGCVRPGKASVGDGIFGFENKNMWRDPFLRGQV